MTTIAQLTDSDVQQAEALLVEWLQTAYPSLDLTPGRVLRDLLIRPAALFHASNAADIETLRRSMSLQQIAADPTLADTTTVDNVLSNLLITRDAGQNASGQVRIIISSALMTQVDKGTTFTANGLNFTTTQTFIGVPSSRLAVNATTRVINSRADGNYEFIIDVTATAPGAEYNLAGGTRMTTATTIPNVLDIATVTDFTGGRAFESNAELVQRVQQGLSPKVLSSRAHIAALIKEQFAALTDVSIIGVADSEMRRDSGNVFGVSMGGKADIYARTAALPALEAVTITATMQNTATKQLSFTLDRDAAAGVYDLVGVYKTSDSSVNANTPLSTLAANSLTIVQKTWTYNTTFSGDFVPYINSRQDAAFTRYQQLVTTITDPSSALSVGASTTYTAYVLRMPLIADIQDFINARSRRNPGADYLVRAPIPAMCSLGLQIVAREPAEVDVDAIANNVVQRVNALTFSVGYLPGSVVVDAVQSLLPSDAALKMPVTLLAKVYLPDGTTKTISDASQLDAPVEADALISSRTVAYFLRRPDIKVTVSSLNTREV